MALKPSQMRYLRGLAHPLKPVLRLGTRGITGSLTQELGRVLDDHELIKVKLANGSRAARADELARLVAVSHCETVQTLGRVAVLYRRNDERPRIALPK
jgi:RNA-binding protein